MKRFLTLCVALLAIFLFQPSAQATFIFGDGGTSLQGVLDGITTAPVSGDSSVDVTANNLSDLVDSHWSITGSGGSISTVVVELAAFATDNIFGVYSAGQYIPLFIGSNVAGDQAVLSIKVDGSVYVNLVDTGIDFAGNLFGYYLDSTVNTSGGLWHSDTSLNSDGLDHMAVYQGMDIDTVQLPTLAPGLWTDNEYVLAFEDLDASVSDKDYTDFVVMVESITPAVVPEPGTLLLLSSGLVGFAGYGKLRLRRRKKK